MSNLCNFSKRWEPRETQGSLVLKKYNKRGNLRKGLKNTDRPHYCRENKKHAWLCRQEAGLKCDSEVRLRKGSGKCKLKVYSKGHRFSFPLQNEGVSGRVVWFCLVGLVFTVRTLEKGKRNELQTEKGESCRKGKWEHERHDFHETMRNYSY